VAKFKHSDFSTCVAPCPGRPKTVTTPQIIDQIYEIILEDIRISAKSIAEQLGISRERVGFIIHEDLGMRKPSAKWVPNACTPIKNVNGASRLSNIWNLFGAIQIIYCRDWWPWTKPGYITMNRRQRNNQCNGSIGAPPPEIKTFQVQKFAGKVLASICWDQNSILLIDYLRKGQTINAEYNSSLLVKLIDFWRKTAAINSPNFLFLHDNAPAHRSLISQKKLA